VQRVGDGRDHERLAEPRDPHEQGVAARHDRCENPLEYLALPHDAAAHLLQQARLGRGEPLQQLDVSIVPA
jgi:hypothetical protein